MPDELEPRLNLGGLGKLVDLLNKFSNPKDIADVEAQLQVVLADAQALLLAVDKLESDASLLVSKFQALLSEQK